MMPVSTCSAVTFHVVSHVIQKLKAAVRNLSFLEMAACLLICTDPSAYLIEALGQMRMLVCIGRQTQHQIEQ